MSDPQKTTKVGKTRIPLMTAAERAEGARGFVVVTNANPLPTGCSAYKLVVNANAVINGYEERKADGGGSKNMLTKRGLAGLTLVTLSVLTPPKHNPVTLLTVASGSIIAYLEDSLK